MSATISGTPWTATCVTTATYVGNIVAIVGTDNAFSPTTANIMTLTMIPVTGPQTFLLGPIMAAAGDPVNLSTGALNNGGNRWQADRTQGGGFIRIDTLSTTAASGTFTFDAPLSGVNLTVPQTKAITNGVFSVRF